MLVCDIGCAIISSILKTGKFTVLPVHWYFELNNKNCPKKNELDYDDWLKVIKQLPFYSDITLTGDNPTKHKDFYKILKSASEKTLSKVNLIVDISSLNEDVINNITDAKLKFLTLTMDKYEDKNAAIYLDNLSRACSKKNINITVEILSKVTKNNIKDLLKIYELATNKGVDYFTIQFEKNNELQHNFKLSETFGKKFYDQNYPIKQYFDMDEFEKTYVELYKLKKYSKTKIKFMPEFENIDSIKTFFNSQNKDVKEIYEPCNYPYMNLTINPMGDIYPCLSFKLGNIREENIKDIVNSRNYRVFMRHFQIRKIFSSCTMCQELKVKEYK